MDNIKKISMMCLVVVLLPYSPFGPMYPYSHSPSDLLRCIVFMRIMTPDYCLDQDFRSVSENVQPYVTAWIILITY